MFSYYGSKSKIVKKYPKPECGTVIEPFAGSARYALLHNHLRVILNDKYKVVADIWDFLIHASEGDIDSLPEMAEGEDVRDRHLPVVQRNLMGFIINSGVSTPRSICSPWAFKKGEIKKHKTRFKEFLPKIRHWTVTNKDYTSIANEKATWFIDPPYQYGRGVYAHMDVDYAQLALWCKTRCGQVVVCEQSPANWLNFRPFLTMISQQNRTNQELIWTNL